MKFAAKFACSSLLLGSFAYAQATATDPPPPPAPNPAPTSATSAMVSPGETGRIQPLPAATPDVTPEADIVADPASLLPDLPPVPRAKATLIGGTVERLDRVRDRVTVRVFGGGRMSVLYDPRTRVYLGTKDASIADLHEGERIYIDTILDGNTVFARSIRVKSAQAQGESQGTVTEYRADGGELTLRDSISPTPVRVRLNSSTRFLQGDLVVPAGTLLAGSLVAIKFNSEGNGRDVAREITILALPGTRYTFAGQVTHVDLRTGLVVISSSTDQKSYEIYLDPSAPPDDDLHPGAMVTVVTDFRGSRYVARTLTIDSQGK